MCLFTSLLPLFLPARSLKWLWELLGSFQRSLIKWKWFWTLQVGQWIKCVWSCFLAQNSSYPCYSAHFPTHSVLRMILGLTPISCPRIAGTNFWVGLFWDLQTIVDISPTKLGNTNKPTRYRGGEETTTAFNSSSFHEFLSGSAITFLKTTWMISVFENLVSVGLQGSPFLQKCGI